MYIWIVDIDGTVADTGPRLDAICTKYGVDVDHLNVEQLKEWMASEHLKNDPLVKGAEILPDLARRCGAKLVFLTGRSECIRKETRIWLGNKLDIFNNTVPLIMRNLGDMRSGSVVKEELFVNAALTVYRDAHFIFFDDDVELLKIYSRYGLALKAPEIWDVVRFGRMPVVC